MKILHVHLNGPFTENWSYQENHLSEEHKRMGHEVIIIANCYTFNERGLIVETLPIDKILPNGVRLIRVKRHITLLKKYNDVFRPYKIYHLIEMIKPDFIINHGLIGSVAGFDVIKYIKKNAQNTKFVADIHEDYYVGPRDNTIKLKALRLIRILQNKCLIKYVDKVFYINPMCRLYAEKYYKVPKQKLEFLPIGSDFHLIEELESHNSRFTVRTQLNISSEDIIICHGGKLGTQKRSIELIDAVIKIHSEHSNIHLILFGPVLEDIRHLFFSKIQNLSFISYLGILDTRKFYELFLATDICIFPGTDSALWIQAITCGNALAITKNYFADYIDFGGNIEIMKSYNPSDIYISIKSLIANDRYKEMKKIARMKSRPLLSYEEIAKKILL